MKNAFKKSFKSTIVEPFLFGVIVVLILQFLIFPYFNIISSFRNLFITSLLSAFLFFSLKYFYLKIFINENESFDYTNNFIEDETGTELDFIPKYEYEMKRKKVKKSDLITKKKV